MPTDLVVTLDAVIVAVTDGRPRVLTVTEEPPAIPSGTLDLDGDETLERGIRRVITDQTGIEVGYVEQLYTFGDRDRTRSGPARVLSVAYLALVREAGTAPGAAWLDWYAMLPWEDRREGIPEATVEFVLPLLDAWAGSDLRRRERIGVCFGVDTPWDPIRSLERYELLYEADLVAEAFRDRGEPVPPDLPTGIELAVDHRRICATALGRLRGKLTYRPVVFELMPDEFTLTELQRTVEALVGLRLHKQNFRRLIERERLVEGTGRFAPSTGGRPAELYRFRRSVVGERPRPGMRLPPFRA